MTTNFGKTPFQIHSSPLGFNDFCSQFSILNKFRLIGMGMYAHVYGSSKSDFVYKIGKIEKTIQTDPYLQFLSQAQPNNPYFPKVRTITIFKNLKGSFYVVEMEKLSRCIPKKLNSHSFNFLKILDNLFQARSFYGWGKLWEKYFDQFKNNEKVLYILKCLRELLRKFSNDLHAANMMMRPNGQLVITDPLCPRGLSTVIVFK